MTTHGSFVEQLFHQYRDRVYGFFVDFLNDKELARDLTQDVFVRLLIKEDGFQNVRDMDGYIYQTCRNLAFDHLKKAAHNTEYRNFIQLAGNPAVINETNPTDLRIDEDYYKYVLDASLSKLPEQQRLIFTLSKIDGLSHKKIASQLGISTFTVRNHLHQAMKNLRMNIPQSDLYSAITLLILLCPWS